MTSEPDPSRTSKRVVNLAFQAIFETELRYVWNSLRYLGIRPADLEDVAQDVFLTALRLLDTNEPVRSVRAWLFTLCFHAASNHRRKASLSCEVSKEDIDVESSYGDPELRAQARQKLLLVIAALDRMSTDRKAVLVMHDIDGHAMPVIAESLKIPLATAYSRLRLARKDFQAALEEIQTQGRSS